MYDDYPKADLFGRRTWSRACQDAKWHLGTGNPLWHSLSCVCVACFAADYTVVGHVIPGPLFSGEQKPPQPEPWLD